MTRKAKTIIHVNQHIIRSNKKYGHADPPLTVRRGKHIAHRDNVVIYGQDGLPAATVRYSPDKPLSCGARVWIETTGQVDALTPSC